jgi:leucyl-tRNA---protein transferase
MFCNINAPAYLSPHNLDKYLERGWFRMGQSMFTTSFLNFNNTLFNAIWLRYDLQNYNLKASGKTILKQNKNFSVQVNPFSFSPEKDRLFKKYREALPFSIAHSLKTLLLDEGQFTIFNTFEICVYDGSTLIGMGVFDLGLNTAQGIINFYDPTYKKYSLGKFLILEKINYLKKIGFTFFYPGYFAPGYSPFDYKTELSVSGVSFFDVSTENWIDYHDFELDNAPLQLIYQKLNTLEKTKTFKNLGIHVNHYKFYDVKLFKEYAVYDLLNVPYFILLSPLDTHKELLILYNIQKEMYQICICCHVFEINIPIQEGVYNNYFLRLEDVIYETNKVELLVKYVLDNQMHYASVF